MPRLPTPIRTPIWLALVAATKPETPKLTDQFLCDFEGWVIEHTGDGELAAHLTRYLMGMRDARLAEGIAAVERKAFECGCTGGSFEFATTEAEKAFRERVLTHLGVPWAPRIPSGTPTPPGPSNAAVEAVARELCDGPALEDTLKRILDVPKEKRPTTKEGVAALRMAEYRELASTLLAIAYEAEGAC